MYAISRRGKVLSLALIMGLLVLGSSQAHAWSVSVGVRDSDYRHDRNHHDRNYGYGRTIRHLPYGATVVRVGRDRYYYHAGHYYRPCASGYERVRAPRGAYVRHLPRGHKRVVYHNRPYYVYNEVYYMQNPQGYQVVDLPLQSAVIEQRNVTSRINGDLEYITVNIPRASGNGTQEVVLLRDGHGFVGPEGEYYGTFPENRQLQAKYGR